MCPSTRKQAECSMDLESRIPGPEPQIPGLTARAVCFTLRALSENPAMTS
jgi:hypothetical protein